MSTVKQLIITEKHVQTDRVRPYDYIASASDLGVSVGKYPRAFRTTLGDGKPFWFDCVVKATITTVVYKQRSGLRLTIFDN